jgi:membrane associated rhomboid family serine protease
LTDRRRPYCVWYDRAVPRSPYASSLSYTLGPGPWTPGVKALILANVAVFLLAFFVPAVTIYLGLTPVAVIRELWVWQPVTYMFVHRETFHILLNMLAAWMFGVELERMWGTRQFVKYWFITGIGAGLTTMLVSLLPFSFAGPVYYSLTIGASGAVYGLLLAYALYFPNRPLFLFPIPIPIAAKYFVMILGALAFLSSMSAASSGIAHAAHLGGLVVGYLYLTRGRGGPMAELKYRWVKWKMARMRRRFDVVSGGRGGWDGRYH